MESGDKDHISHFVLQTKNNLNVTTMPGKFIQYVHRIHNVKDILGSSLRLKHQTHKETVSSLWYILPGNISRDALIVWLEIRMGQF